MVIGADQRRVALGVVSLLCLAWAALGVAGIVTAYATPVGMDGTGGYLFLLAIAGASLVLIALSAWATGVRAIRMADAGVLSRRTLLVVTGVGSVASALSGATVIASLPVVGVLLVVQSVALPGFAAILRPVSAT
jgi:hypothetical protein